MDESSDIDDVIPEQVHEGHAKSGTDNGKEEVSHGSGNAGAEDSQNEDVGFGSNANNLSLLMEVSVSTAVDF